jgi:hypothetical protein
MNVSLLLGSGHGSISEPLTTLVTVPPKDVMATEIDALNRRLDLKQIDFTEYVFSLERLMEKEL